VSELFRPSDLGNRSEQEFFDLLGKESAKPGESVRDDWYGKIHLDEKTVALVKELRSRYKVALCSNSSRWLFERATCEYVTPMTELFDAVVVSADVGMAKPDKNIFDLTLNRLGILAEEAVFTDDSLKNIKAAQSLGLTGILFEDANKFRKELVALGFVF
jgi:putative hydrolase of the HAD superfamily